MDSMRVYRESDAKREEVYFKFPTSELKQLSISRAGNLEFFSEV